MLRGTRENEIKSINTVYLYTPFINYAISILVVVTIDYIQVS